MEGKFTQRHLQHEPLVASMKALPKRKGNVIRDFDTYTALATSIKAPTKKQGNNMDGESFETTQVPQ